MTWKSYAVVSGATVLAGWLASTPPSRAPTGTASVSREPGVDRDASPSDIQREAERLQARVRREVLYAQPQRNPFRFGDSRADEDRGGDIPAPVPEPTVVIPAAPPPPPVSLSGIAEDQAGERLERTAILSSPSGVLLVREGDQVAGEYTVQRIESEAIDLVKSDGTILRLTLKP
jgi:hypothetical protein